MTATTHRVALIGYGRFGRALESLVHAAGGTLRAFDPYQAPPDGVRAESLEDVLTDATVIVVGVPFGHIEESLRALRPHLRPGPLLIDICSVKVRPVARMSALIPKGVAWVGTHPLFGPTTLALKEKPLRAVVCPNPAQPESTTRARAFYEWLGCEVLEQSADEHDRVMAESHLAACFVAEGLIGAGISTDQPFVTPSFRALARVMESMKAEADHLRAAVYQGNPYGEAARKRLLVALESVDRLLEPPETSSPGAMPLETDEEPRVALTQARAEIDELDKKLVKLLARRAELSRRVVAIKDQLGVGVHDPSREDNMFRMRRAWSSALGLNADAMENIFRAIVQFSRELQHAQLKQGGTPQ